MAADMNAKIGAAVKSLRQDKGIPRALLAKRLDTDDDGVYRIETGDASLTTGDLRSLATALQVDVTVLLERAR